MLVAFSPRKSRCCGDDLRAPGMLVMQMQDLVHYHLATATVRGSERMDVPLVGEPG